VNFLTLAGDEAEYRSKVASALATIDLNSTDLRTCGGLYYLTIRRKN
jgi:hypothetical protein